MNTPSRLRAAGTGFIAGIGLLLAATTAQAETSGSFAGFWKVEGQHDALRTEEGKAPPLKPASRKLYEQRQRDRKAGKTDFDTLASCLPHGLPRLLTAPSAIEVLEEPKQITFLHEAHHMPRLVYLDETLPDAEELEHNYMGASVGKKQGNTLSIQSAGFNDLTTLDKAGLPHSEALTLTEEWRLTEGVQRIETRVTVTDAEHYTRPWSFRLQFKRLPADTWLAEFVCTDRNPDV